MNPGIDEPPLSGLSEGGVNMVDSPGGTLPSPMPFGMGGIRDVASGLDIGGCPIPSDDGIGCR